MNRIEDIAIDRGWSFRRKLWKSRIKYFFQQRLFPRLYRRKLDRAIMEYENKEGKR